MAKAVKKMVKAKSPTKTSAKAVGTKEAKKPATTPKAETNSPKTFFHETELTKTQQCRSGIMTYLKNDLYCGRSLETYGEFLPGEAALFRQLVRPNAWIVDVGANIGHHAVLFAELAGARGRIIAYEPQRTLYQILCGNAAINGCLNIEARLAYAGASAGTHPTAVLNYAEKGDFTLIPLRGNESGERVPVETIDSLNLAACHFFRIGVEDTALEALKGARATLLRHRPIIYCRNGNSARSKPLIELLFNLNYRAYWHLSHYFSPDNVFRNPKNVFPGLVAVNLLCLPRELNLEIAGGNEVKSADEDWRKIFLKPKS